MSDRELVTVRGVVTPAELIVGFGAGPAWDLVKLLSLGARKGVMGWEAKPARALTAAGMVDPPQGERLRRCLGETNWSSLLETLDADNDVLLDKLAVRRGLQRVDLARIV